MEMTKPTYLSFVYVAGEVAAVESEGKTVKKTFQANPMLLLPVLKVNQ